MITITLDDRELRQRLATLQAHLGNLTPAMQDIGELLVASTKARFASGRSPGGQPWAVNRPVTLARYLRNYGGSYKKDGSLSKPGMTRLAGKRPLVGESRRLSSEIFYRADAHGVTVGSGLVYAAVQQFGARKGQFGADARGHPLPWGRIPARPFLGLSLRDRADIEATLAHWLARAL